MHIFLQYKDTDTYVNHWHTTAMSFPSRYHSPFGLNFREHIFDP